MDDADRLKATLCKVLAIDPAAHDTTNIARAPQQNGIRGFLTGLAMLREEDIMGLHVRAADGTVGLLSITDRRSSVAFLALFHDTSRPFKQPIDPTELSKVQYDIYRISEIRHKNTVIPFKIALPEESNGELSLWNKKN